MSEYEVKLLEMLNKSFDSGEYHYDFDLPDNENERNELISAINHLEQMGCIMIIASPERTNDDFIEVEMSPPCCK